MGPELRRSQAARPGLRRSQAARAEALAALARPLSYPDELPVSGEAGRLADAIRAHQVVVVAGETGSGKSTQLPKICIDAGRGTAGIIGHTQPRRIAARSIAERVAEELGADVGKLVGFKVRFTDQVGPGTVIKLMTDGVLLAELQNDPKLRSYDTLIIDEAHERSLNIDFILGYLKRLLPSRPDLHVVITSATIDTERFAAHFDGAPVIEVTGRTFPVEIRYRPYGDAGLAAGNAEGLAGSVAGTSDVRVSDGGQPLVYDEVEAVCDAVGELCSVGPGDILVFLPGEREIRDAADALAKCAPEPLEILGLYGRLSSADQHRIFEPHSGRRVVLATNVAETSLTVPGIRFVVDTGTARVSRYSRRTKVQRLPIEPVSQASANQRSGRCGRTGPGTCIRLYSQEDFDGRRAFTEPEILRTNLASVVLQMAAIGLGPAEDFPFIDPPERRNINDGVLLLREIGAFSGAEDDLTALGRKLARLPLDPRLGRMVLEADRLGCLPEVLVITAGLSVQDPRERPADKREAANALHARFDDQGSDFLSYVSLWDYLYERREELSSGQFRRLCGKEMISYQRAREWQDVRSQLADLCRQLGLGVAKGSRPRGRLNDAEKAMVHQALLAGVPTQVGAREGERADFAAPRSTRFAIWPGSAVAKRPPRWVMAAELVETGRLWGRTVAPVQPRWVEKAAAHLLKWSYSEPLWDASRAEAYVVARATLYGLAVVPGRRTELARSDSEQARELFVRHALAMGDWERAPDLVGSNIQTLEGLRALMQRARRQDLMVGEEALVRFYEGRLGRDVVSAATFERWWRKLSSEQRHALVASESDLLPHDGASVGDEKFPDSWALPAGGALCLEYNWEPGSDDDGVVVEVPVRDLARLDREGIEWQVPGLREELVTALLRSLDKQIRRQLVPVAEHAKEFVAEAQPSDGRLADVLARFVSSRSGTAVGPEDFDWARVPAHLRPTYRVIGESGDVLARAKETPALLHQLQPRFEKALQDAASSAALAWGPAGITATSWEFGDLPAEFTPYWQGYPLRGYPVLADEGDHVRLVVTSDSARGTEVMRAGLRRLVWLGLPARRQLLSALENMLDNPARLAIAGLGPIAHGSPRRLAQDVLESALDRAIAQHGALPHDPVSFSELLGFVKGSVDQLSRAQMRAAARVIRALFD
ncbi:MAG TPA: ATP-dependent RNA helicase HrpA, partial [Acidimicrobiales bacterium]|nr:ATP-dependent RNA helicase HrpA [Acidimicrobiales bacterium]